MRHLPVFGSPTFLRSRPPDFGTWSAINNPQTFAYDEHLLLEFVRSTFEDERIKERVGCDTDLLDEE